MQNFSQIRSDFACRICFTVFPISELNPTKQKSYDYRCKKCTSQRLVAYLKANPDKARKFRTTPAAKACRKRIHKRRVIKIRTIVNRLKMKPCVDCQGWFEPVQMQFDHLPKFTKSFELSVAATHGLKQVLAEIAKCEVVCANCHALRTHKRRQAA